MNWNNYIDTIFDMPGRLFIYHKSQMYYVPFPGQRGSSFSCPIIPLPIMVVLIKYIRLSFLTKEIKRLVCVFGHISITLLGFRVYKRGLKEEAAF